jgi:plasmid stabilization system protein ParE
VRVIGCGPREADLRRRTWHPSFWRLKKYPHLVFYVERSDHIDVWRVLHGTRDIPSWMQDPDLI